LPDIPPAAITAAAEAMNEAHAKRGWNKPQSWWVNEVVTAALEAAAPLLAEAVAQKILAHMDEHGPGPASPGVTLHETMRRAWHRHFGIAARVAAGAFYTREDHLRLAAEAIERGDCIACDIPEVPREP
jgi:hypothetical protein